MKKEKNNRILLSAFYHFILTLPSDPPLQCHHNFPKAGGPYHDPAQRFSLEPMNLECPDCHALHFKATKLTKSKHY